MVIIQISEQSKISVKEVEKDEEASAMGLGHGVLFFDDNVYRVQARIGGQKNDGMFQV